MSGLHWISASCIALCAAGMAAAQSYGSAGGTNRSGNASYFGAPNQHVGFDRPEAWALKYFASTTMLSGLQPPARAEGHRVGSVDIGVELSWLPMLNAGQMRVGFNGIAPEDLNKAPILARPVVRVGLPWKLTAVAAAPPLFELFGVTPRLFAFGVERPVFEREGWMVGWRGSGQIGWVKGAFTCPHGVLAFEPGSPDNPQECVGESADKATLRYAGMELQVAHRLRSMPKVTPHVAVGGNFIDGVFHVHAPLKGGLDQTRLWTRGGTFSASGGVSYALSQRVSLTVDAFYSPLWVKRSPDLPRTNDGLFNVRALVSYSFR